VRKSNDEDFKSKMDRESKPQKNDADEQQRTKDGREEKGGQRETLHLKEETRQRYVRKAHDEAAQQI